MSYIPPQPVKSREIRERYRKKRRRQLIGIVGASLLGVIFIALLFGLVLVVRGCLSRRPEPVLDRSYRRDADDRRLARKVAQHEFAPAPWMYAINDSRLVVSLDKAQRTHDNPQCPPQDTLACYSFGSPSAAWELPFDGGFCRFGAGEETAYGIRQFSADIEQVEARGYDLKTGRSAWDFRIDRAELANVVSQEETFTIVYWLPDGWRMATYNARTGTKAFGIMIPLRGLARREYDRSVSIEFTTQAWDKLIGYYSFNVIGMVNPENCKLVSEHALNGNIYAAVFDPARREGFALIEGAGAGNFDVVKVGTEGHPQKLTTVRCQPELAWRVLLVASEGWLAMGIPQGSGANVTGTDLVFINQAQDGDVISIPVEYGIIEDLSSLPASPGQFLVAVNESWDEWGSPRGWGEIELVNCQEESIRRIKRFKRPVSYLVRFKQDCLVLVDGGIVMSYVHEGPALVQLERLKYPKLRPLMSNSGKRLAVLSTTEAYLHAETGQPMQVMLFD